MDSSAITQTGMKISHLHQPILDLQQAAPSAAYFRDRKEKETNKNNPRTLVMIASRQATRVTPVSG